MNNIPQPPEGFGPPVKGPLAVFQHEKLGDVIAYHSSGWCDNRGHGYVGLDVTAWYSLRLNSPIEIANRPTPPKPTYQILTLSYRLKCRYCPATEVATIDIEDGDDIAAVEVSIHMDMEEREWINGHCPACYHDQPEPEPYVAGEDY
jgi:hypothetical protein